jgi:hypothetical protein
MKKVFLAILLVVGMTAIAQETKIEKPRKEKMSSEQKVELYVKKMKLDLDLNDKQVTEVKKLAEVQFQKREAKRAEIKAKREEEKKIRDEKRFEMKNQMLDEQIAQKAEMKKILTPEQYAKWEKIQSERKEKMKGRKNRKMHEKE